MNKTRELDPSEVFAVLMSGLDDDGERAAIVIVRGPRGQVSVSPVDEQAAAAGCNSCSGDSLRGKPVLDGVYSRAAERRLRQFRLA
jgi:hypothetical protein